MAVGIAWPAVRPGSLVVAATPGGTSVALKADTLIGRAIWAFGEFERHELLTAHKLAAPGTFAFDVGANVGLFTVVMSRAVGPRGRVIAVEPVPETVDELHANLDRNLCTNVDIVVGAAAASSGEIPLRWTDDPALHSAGGEVVAGHPVARTTMATAHTLDGLWAAAGRPPVSLVKIDVEGGEKAVLQGAAEMLAEARPAIIVEVNDRRELVRIIELLGGYRPRAVPGFEPWNHLLLPSEPPPRRVRSVSPC